MMIIVQIPAPTVVKKTDDALGKAHDQENENESQNKLPKFDARNRIVQPDKGAGPYNRAKYGTNPPQQYHQQKN